MKNIYQLIFVFGLISFASCSSDSDCTSDSFVGSFSGVVNCPDEPEASGTLTITKISDSEIKVTDIDNVEFNMEVSGCVATSSINFFGISVTQTLTLNGDKLDYKAVNSGMDIDITCTGSMTRN